MYPTPVGFSRSPSSSGVSRGGPTLELLAPAEPLLEGQRVDEACPLGVEEAEPLAEWETEQLDQVTGAATAEGAEAPSEVTGTESPVAEAPEADAQEIAAATSEVPATEA